MIEVAGAKDRTGGHLGRESFAVDFLIGLTGGLFPSSDRTRFEQTLLERDLLLNPRFRAANIDFGNILSTSWTSQKASLAAQLIQLNRPKLAAVRESNEQAQLNFTPRTW
jgi:hypothetical protein